METPDGLSEYFGMIGDKSMSGEAGVMRWRPSEGGRGHSPKMVNIPHALFDSRTGREPRYHISIDELPDWAYAGASLGPLKGYPGVVWHRPRKPKTSEQD